MPTANELIDAKVAIEQVEIELKDALLSLEQAQLRVANLEKDLKERRALISPIRRLSYDVLSLIFEFCGENNWRTPLRIAGVSRLWITLVLATPRAWAFLHVHECDDADEDLIQHFFQHSGQRPIHVFLSESQGSTLISGVAGRLVCLSVDDWSQIEEIPVLPKLESLSLRSVDDCIGLWNFCVARFPALRELICEARIDIPWPSSFAVTFPPQQILSVTIEVDSAWLDLLMGCRSSLVSLRLHIVDVYPDSTTQDLLPMLRCLEIILSGDYPEFWPISLKTPATETYKEGTKSLFPPAGTTPIHGNVGNVTRARFFAAADLSAMSSLHTLQLKFGVDIPNVLSQLQLNPSLCPRLELIEILQVGDLAPYETSLVAVNKERTQPISIRKVETRVTALPYEISPSPVSA